MPQSAVDEIYAQLAASGQIGDEGSAQALAATRGGPPPPLAPAPAVPNAPPPIAQQVASMPPAGAPPPAQPAPPQLGVTARQPANLVPYRSTANDNAGPGLAAPQLGRLPAGGPLRLQPTTEDTKITGKTGPYSDLAGQAALQALGARGELAGAELEAQGAQGAAERKRSELAAIYDESAATKRALRLGEAHAYLSDYHRKIDRVMREADDMKVDPNKYFKDMSPAQGIIGALLAAVSGFGYGYSGRGINPAEFLNQRIRDSIDSQKEAIANKRATVGEMRNHLEEMRQLFGDHDQAELATELAQRQYVMAHLQNWANDQSTPALQRLNAAKIRSDLAGDQAKTLEQLDDRTLSTFERTQAAKYAATGGANYGVTIDIGGKKQVVPLALYKQLQEAGLAPEAPKEAREGRKVEAETGKTLAETANIAGGPEAKVRGAELEAKARGSAAGYFHDPIALLTQHFSDTTGEEHKLAREAVNADTIGKLRKAGIISARGGIEGSPAEHFIIHDGDSPGTIDQKLKMRDLFLGGPSSAAAPSPNAVEEGAGEADAAPKDDARFGELGVLKRPDGDVSTEISITVTDPRLNGGRATNIPTLVRGQRNVQSLLAGKDPTDEQQELAIRRAVERQKAGALLPSYGSIDEAVREAEARTKNKGVSVPYTQGRR